MKAQQHNVNPPAAGARPLPGRLLAVTPDVFRLIEEAVQIERERHARIVHSARLVSAHAWGTGVSEAHHWARLIDMDSLRAAVADYDAAALPAQPDKQKGVL
jgi:hypothetical protein